MARLNIEDRLYQDNRFTKLTIKLKDQEAALGALVRAWTLAQKWWLTENKMIPKKEWEKQEIKNEIIEVGLAEIMGDYVRMNGSDEQFSWLSNQREKGLKSALKRQSTAVNHGSTAVEPRPTSYSFSNSYSKKRKKKEEGTEQTSATADVPSVIAAATIPQELFNGWLKTYKDEEWISHEIKKAETWIIANPRRAPKKNFASFFNNWLSRGWEAYRKTIKSKPVFAVER